MFRSILFSSWNNLKTFGNYSKVLFQSSKEKLQAFEMIPTLKTIIYGGLHLCKQAIGKIKHLNTVFIQQRLPVFHQYLNPKSTDIAFGQGKHFEHSGSVNVSSRGGFPYKTTIALAIFGSYGILGYALSNVQDMLDEGKKSMNQQNEYIKGIKWKFPEPIDFTQQDQIRNSLEYNIQHKENGITFVYGPSGTGKTTTIFRALDDLLHVESYDELNPVDTEQNRKSEHDQSQDESKQKSNCNDSSDSYQKEMEKYRFVIVDLKKFDEVGVEKASRNFLSECAWYYYEKSLYENKAHWMARVLLFPCRFFFRSTKEESWWETLVDYLKHIVPWAKPNPTRAAEMCALFDVAKKLHAYHLIPNEDPTMDDQENSNSNSFTGVLYNLVSTSHAHRNIRNFPSLFTCALDMLRETSKGKPTIITLLDGQNVALLRRIGEEGDEKTSVLSTTDLYLSIARNIVDFFSSPSTKEYHMQLIIETSDCAAGIAFLDMQSKPVTKVLVDGWWNREYEVANSKNKYILKDTYAETMAMNFYYWLRRRSDGTLKTGDISPCRSKFKEEKSAIFNELNDEEKEFFIQQIKDIYKIVGLHASDWYAYAWYLSRQNAGKKELLCNKKFKKNIRTATEKAKRSIIEQAEIDITRAKRTYCVYSSTMNWSEQKDSKTHASNGSMWGLRRMSNAGEHFLPFYGEDGPCSTLNFIKAIEHADDIAGNSETIDEAERKSDIADSLGHSSKFCFLLMSPEAMGLSRAGLFVIFPTMEDIGTVFRLQHPSLQSCIDEIKKHCPKFEKIREEEKERKMKENEDEENRKDSRYVKRELELEERRHQLQLEREKQLILFREELNQKNNDYGTTLRNCMVSLTLVAGSAVMLSLVYKMFEKE